MWKMRGFFFPASRKLFPQLATDSHFTGEPFLHRLENRPQNPKNHPTSNVCRNRASWRILMKPCANERVWFNFSKKKLNFEFLLIFQYFTAIWTWTRFVFSDISKKAQNELFSRKKMSISSEIFLKIFFWSFSILQSHKNVQTRFEIAFLDLEIYIFENFIFRIFVSFP